jgi:hypothetical protein
MRIVEIGKKNGFENYIIILSDDDILDIDPFLYMCSNNMMRIAYKTMLLDSHRHNVDFYIPFAKKQSIEMVSSYSKIPVPIQLKNILHTKGKRNQEKLLKGFSFTPEEFISFLLFAGRNSYTFSQIFYERDVPNDLKDRIPIVIDASNDPITTIGKTDLSVDALKHIVREKKRIIAQFLTNNENWICFYRTSKGLSGVC